MSLPIPHLVSTRPIDRVTAKEHLSQQQGHDMRLYPQRHSTAFAAAALARMQGRSGGWRPQAVHPAEPRAGASQGFASAQTQGLASRLYEMLFPTGACMACSQGRQNEQAHGQDRLKNDAFGSVRKHWNPTETLKPHWPFGWDTGWANG